MGDEMLCFMVNRIINPEGQVAATGHAAFEKLGDRIWGDLSEPQVPFDAVVARRGTLSIRPTSDATFESVNLVTAREGQVDLIEPVTLKPGALFTDIPFLPGQAINVIGQIGGVTHRTVFYP